MGNQQVSLENLYKIKPLSDTLFHDGNGNIFSTKRGKLKKLTLIPHGGKTKKTQYRVKVLGRLWMVHHLVCIEKYNRLMVCGESVNHLDGDTENNSPENLEFSTHEKQCIHAKQNKLYCCGEDWYKARKLIQILSRNFRDY